MQGAALHHWSRAFSLVEEVYLGAGVVAGGLPCHTCPYIADLGAKLGESYQD